MDVKITKLFITILTMAFLTVSALGQDGAPPALETQAPEKPEVSAAPEAQPKPAPPAVQPKLEGTIRIGIVTTKTQLGPDVSGAEASEAVRQLWMSYLKGPTVDVVAIDAKSPTNINAEAKQKECDFVLYSGLVKKTKTSLFGSLVKIAAPVITSQIPGAGDTAGEAVTGRGKQAIANSGKELARNTIASGIGVKDEITLEINLFVTGGASAVKSSASAKAKSDGEDVFTMLIEQASEKVLQAAVKK